MNPEQGGVENVGKSQTEVMQGAKKKRAGLMRRSLSAVLSATPVVGTVKAWGEAVVGETASGDSLIGKRFKHAAVGTIPVAGNLYQAGKEFSKNKH
jgi:hypothetical protein